MGVVAPVAALVSVILPVAFGIFNDGLPPTQQLAGFLFAFLAVWLLGRGDHSSPFRLQDLKLPVAAGIGFGIFFILIDQVSSVSLLWPLVSARIASVILILIIALVGGKSLAPARNQLLFIVLVGVLDSGGNVFYALATRVGRLDISAVLASLYPAITVLLAWIILNEKLTSRGWLGVIAALLALVLIAF
jgi:drug/metabolite transporter (DMT)-like permease